jgi:hypothetical protein
MVVVWDVVMCSMVDIFFYESTQRNIPEDIHLHTPRRENLKSHISNNVALKSDFGFSDTNLFASKKYLPENKLQIYSTSSILRPR